MQHTRRTVGKATEGGMAPPP